MADKKDVTGKNPNLLPKIKERIRAVSKLSVILMGVVEEFKLSTKQVNGLAKDSEGFISRFRDFMAIESNNFANDGDSEIDISELSEGIMPNSAGVSDAENDYAGLIDGNPEEAKSANDSIAEIFEKLSTLDSIAENDKNDVAPRIVFESTMLQDTFMEKKNLDVCDFVQANDNLRTKPESIKLIEEFLMNVWGSKADFSKIKIPERKDDNWKFDRLLVFPALSFSEIFQGFAKFGITIGFTTEILNAMGETVRKKEELPGIYQRVVSRFDELLISQRSSIAPYAFWIYSNFSESAELLDEKGFGISAAELINKKIPVLGLEEILFNELFSLWLLKRDGQNIYQHLIVDNVSVCAGSQLVFEHDGENTVVIPRFGRYNGFLAIGRYSLYQTAKNIKAQMLII